MSEKKKSIKKQKNPYKPGNAQGMNSVNKGGTKGERQIFSYENSDEKFEDLDYELLEKLNKGKLIKGKSYKNQSTSAVKSKPDNRADKREDGRLVRKGSEYGGSEKDSARGLKENSRNVKNTQGSRRDDRRINKRRIIKAGECPYLRDCGGCNFLKHNYEDELKDKQKMVESLLGKFCKVEPIIGMKNPKNYRNKVHVVFDHDRKGNPLSGVYEEGTHRVVPIEQCCIHNEKADAIIASIRGMLKSFKIKTYDENTGHGLLRHVLIRTGFASGEIMVVLVLSSPILPSKNNFVKALRLQHPEITTVVVNVNDKQTSMVLGEKEQVIYGKGFIEDRLCQKVFRISPKSFYQVNPAQTQVLYNKAMKLAELTGEETVIDAYCGIGTIGIIASDHAKRVIGVELNKDAVKDATINARRNEAKNIEFFSNDAGVFMSQMAEQGERVDVVFMDPPRSGSTEQFMDAVVQLKPKKVVYISCNPVTLERDLGYITKKGYKAVKAVAVDMFPWTGHVESVILLHRKNI